MNLRRRLGNFRRLRNEDRDLEQEIQFHLAEEARLLEGRGEGIEEARESARREFGNITLVKEVTREMWGWQSLETLFKDVTYGIRQLRRSRSFTVIAVITLALGIGANTAIFSVIHSLLWRPLPVPSADRIAVLAFEQKGGTLQNEFSIPDYDDIREQSKAVFSGLLGYGMSMDGLTVDGKTAHLYTNYVTGNYFSTLGVQPALGRLILPSEGKHPGDDPVLMLGYGYWKERFNCDPGVLGKKVKVNGHLLTIVGVTPEGFHGLYSLIDTQGYMPVSMSTIEADAGDPMNDRAARSLRIFGKLRPGVTLQQAGSQLAVVAGALSKAYPKTDEGLALKIFAERDARPEPDTDNTMATVATLFLVFTGLVLLLACINVANMLMVRASVRQREMAVRAALGAARVRLIRQLLTESLVLALLGGVGGVLVGLWLSRVLASIHLDTPVPFLLDFHFDWSVFGFALTAAILTGCMVGLVPAIRASRNNLATVLQSGGRSIIAGRNRLRSALVVVQVGASLMLLIAAGLFMRSLDMAQKADLGFDPNQVVNLSFDANEAGYNEAQGRQFTSALLDRVRATTGVVSASLAFSVPMGYYTTEDQLQIPGYQQPKGAAAPDSRYNVISPGYFATMRIPILRGRDISERDTAASQHVAMINESMAKTYWPGQDPIGKQFIAMQDPKHPLEIIGVVRNSRDRGFSGPVKPYFFQALSQNYSAVETLQVRTVGPPEQTIGDLQRLIDTLAPGMPVFTVQTMKQSLYTLNGLLRYQMGAALAAGLGMLGLILAVVGLYGVVSYAAAQRTHEIGIRMALGARAGEILSMIVRQGLVLVGAGVVLGLAAASAGAMLIRDFFVGVSATDPLVYVGVTVLLGAVGLAACYIPARRATRTDPMMALRVE
ncbi:MAG: ABC transporter permease [Bryobacteraceae bacterium]